MLGAASRYLSAGLVRDAAGRIYVVDREPYRYRDLSDTRYHQVKEGETLWSIADLHYGGLPGEEAAWLWWVIADFQPEPILDPTVPPVPGTFLFVPAPQVVAGDVLPGLVARVERSL